MHYWLLVDIEVVFTVCEKMSYHHGTHCRDSTAFISHYEYMQHDEICYELLLLSDRRRIERERD